MSKSVSFLASFLLLVTVISSCSSSTQQGPCDYTEEEFNMRVIDVSEDPENEHMFIVLVDFDGNVKYAEGEHTLSEMRNVTTDLDFVINNHIKVGSIYTGTIHTRVGESSHCDEEIIDWDQKLRK